MAIDIGGMRIAYKSVKEVFLESDLVSREPFGQFKHWFDQACETKEILEANAMNIATATKDGIPSSRMVLLKSYSKEGFVFFTNHGSRKGQEIIENPHACLCFYWEPLKRSVRVEGVVKKFSEEDTEKYFQSRPKSSQIGACVSDQSKVIKSREVLEAKRDELNEKYLHTDVPVPRPKIWGGFLLEPHTIEFWQGQSDRLHDRIRFNRPLADGTGKKISEGEDFTEGEEGWRFQRLSP